jgi:hypothetical protein
MVSAAEIRATLILRCWENEDFAAQFRRDPHAAVADLLPSSTEGLLGSIDMDALSSTRIPPSPLAIESAADWEKVLLAFWEGVFEPQ